MRFEEPAITRMKASCKLRGYPEPDLIMTVWNYKRALCKQCGVDCLVRGYTSHYARKHAENADYYDPNKNRKTNPPKPRRPAKSTVSDDAFIERLNPEAWAEQHKESMARLAKREIRL